MNYYISTEDYLERARQLLDNGEVAGIFYAALELRCGVLSAPQHIKM